MPAHVNVKGKSVEERIQGCVLLIAHSKVVSLKSRTPYCLRRHTHGYLSIAAQHHRPLAGTKLYCSVTEAHVSGRLAQGRCGGRESNPRPVDCKSSALTTTLPSHTRALHTSFGPSNPER